MFKLPVQTVTFKEQEFVVEHGGPFDRGMSDSYYKRDPRPHKMLPHTTELTAEERAQYYLGYEYNESIGDHKEY